jgi:hypothetical protein
MSDYRGEAARQAGPGPMNWRVGQRVCREEDPTQVGTVTEVNRREIRVEWENGAISFHHLGDGHIPLKDATRPPNP